MSRIKKIKMPRGILGSKSGTTSNIAISKNGVIQISKESRNIAKKIISN